MSALSTFTEDLLEKIVLLEPLVANATNHALNLENEALFLDRYYKQKLVCLS